MKGPITIFQATRPPLARPVGFPSPAHAGFGFFRDHNYLTEAELICQQIVSMLFFKIGFQPEKKLFNYQDKSDHRANTAKLNSEHLIKRQGAAALREICFWPP